MPKQVGFFFLICISAFVVVNFAEIINPEVCKDFDRWTISYLPIDANCTFYIECYDMIPVLKQCPPGLWWHQDIEDCDNPGPYCDSSDDDDDPSTTVSTWGTTDTPTSEQPPSTTPPTISTTTFAPSSTTPTDPTTPPSSTEQSTPPPTSSITESSTSTSSEYTTETITTTGSTGSTHHGDPRCYDNSIQYLPHPEYCNMYIECYDGNSYEMRCPPNFFFSDEAKACVTASESECCKNTLSCE